MKKDKFFKKPRYYIDGYVAQIPGWMTKKQAKKVAKEAGSPIFKSFKKAENYRLGSIYGN